MSRKDTLVLTDKVCPGLFREIETHLAAIEVGSVVTLITTEGEQNATVARSVQSDGHTIVGVARRNGTVELTVRKGAPDSSTGSEECCPGGKCK